jgi:hypothetical protein
MTDAGELWGFDGSNKWAHSGMLKSAMHVRNELHKSGILKNIFMKKSRGRNTINTPLNEVYLI